MHPRLQRAPRWQVLALGLVAAAGYLVAGIFVWPAVPLRLLYEGEAPPLPYRWVRPPRNLPEPNQPPLQGTGTIPFTPTGSQSASVLTDDGQAALILRFGAIAPRTGASSVDVRITPLDPNTVAPAPPGLRFDGNAYRMEARDNTGQPVTLLSPATPVLRYPRHATVMLRWADGRWTRLETHVVSGSLQMFGPTDRLGAFVAAAPPPTPQLSWAAYAPVAAAVAGALAALAALLVVRRRAKGAGRST